MEEPILYIHIGCFIYCVVVIFLSDKQALSWVRGKTATLNAAKLHTLHNAMWIGLGLMITTGGFLFWPGHAYWLTKPNFLAKMAFVSALIINGFVIGKFTHIATTRSFASLTNKERLPLLISGAVSFGSWLCAFLLALTLG